MSVLAIDFMYFITVFTAIFAIVDPMGNIPIFYTITQRFTKKERIRIAKRAVIAAIITLFVFALIGQYIFTLFSITIPAFRIAGGLLLFRVAFNMLYGVTPGTKSTEQEKEETLERVESTRPQQPTLPLSYHASTKDGLYERGA